MSDFISDESKPWLGINLEMQPDKTFTLRNIHKNGGASEAVRLTVKEIEHIQLMKDVQLEIDRENNAGRRRQS